MDTSIRNNMRYAVSDPLHSDSGLWNTETIMSIQEDVANRLAFHPDVKKRIIVVEEQIKNVMDSISQQNPHRGTKQVIEMITSYITSYIANEFSINKTPVYDKTILKYDGSQGIVAMSSGQLGIKKKGLNPIGRMF